MNTLKFKPEGWNNTITKLDENNLSDYIEKKQILQGLVRKCDENYNLYVSFDNGLTGIMPRKEVEAINLEESGLPKINLCTGKVNKFIQFKIKDVKDKNNIVISRKEVQEEALNWVKKDLKEGEKVTGIVKNI